MEEGINGSIFLLIYFTGVFILILIFAFRFLRDDNNDDAAIGVTIFWPIVLVALIIFYIVELSKFALQGCNPKFTCERIIKYDEDD